jgi:phosphatidylglycerol lysyltransferase
MDSLASLPGRAADERPRVLALLRRYGCNATSFQVLEPGYHYFFAGDDACVASGAPIAAEERLGDVAELFVSAARRCGRRALFALTERRFLRRSSFAALRVGEQPVWDPARWPDSLHKSRNLREQLRRARAKGVRVRRLDPAELGESDSPLRIAIETLVARWLGSRSMAPLGFLVRVHLFDFVEERRIFIAETDRGLCAMLALVPVYVREGYFAEDLLRTPDAPNGTTELLIDAALRDCAAHGCKYVTLGLAPLAGDVGPLLRVTRELARGLYDFVGLRAFKAKFQPDTWVPIYLSYPRDGHALVAIYDLLAAFARGHVFRFGLATLLRGPAPVVSALTLLLVPWTFALACLDARRFFPAAWVKWAWVSLDVCLFLALSVGMTRARRPHPMLAQLLAYAIAADASVTWLEAMLFNLPRARHPLEWAGSAIAVLAPTLAAVVLNNVAKRSRRLQS